MRLSSLIIAGEAISLLGLVAPVLAQEIALKAFTPQGCFSSSEPLEDQGPDGFQSLGLCQRICVGLGKPVMGLHKGSNCWCGDYVPRADSKVSDSKCSSPCDGYDIETCGGGKAWTVLLTGTDNSVGHIEDSEDFEDTESSSSTKSSKTKSDATSAPDANVTPVGTYRQEATTVVVTAPGQTKPPPTSNADAESKPSKGPNKAGIAAGVVVGVIGFCALIGGLSLYLRNRKRRAIEDEYHRNASHSHHGGASHLSSSAMSDSRLEPSVLMQRRQSDGSIADNQDYSRRILKVTNPDGT